MFHFENQDTPCETREITTLARTSWFPQLQSSSIVSSNSAAANENYKIRKGVSRSPGVSGHQLSNHTPRRTTPVKPRHGSSELT